MFSIRRLMEECGVAMYCDMHAHSRQNNVFIYGCENRRGFDRHLHEQVFPLMLHKNAADKVCHESIYHYFISSIFDSALLIDSSIWNSFSVNKYRIIVCNFCFSFHSKTVNFEYNVVKRVPVG